MKKRIISILFFLMIIFSFSACGNSEKTVYVAPNSGTKYHYSRNCRGLNNANSVSEMNETEAIEEGYGICGFED